MLWLTVVVALAVGWGLTYGRLSDIQADRDRLQKTVTEQEAWLKVFDQKNENTDPFSGKPLRSEMKSPAPGW